MIVAATSVAATAACAGDDDIQRLVVRLGVNRLPSGQVEVIVPDCYEYPADTILLTTGTRTGLSDAIWRVRATSEPKPITRFVVGEVPGGFTEERPLTVALPASQPLHVGVVGDFLGPEGRGNPVASATFTLDQIGDEDIVGGCGED